MPGTPNRRAGLKWLGGALLVPLLLATVFVAAFGWDWLRAPIERVVLEQTGRPLLIGGTLSIGLQGLSPRLEARAVSFANPQWTRHEQMILADVVEITIALPQLLRGKIAFSEVRLTRPVIFLEQGRDGRKNWLLDHQQQDEGARIQISRLTLDHGTLAYDDVRQKTSIRSELSSVQEQGHDRLAFTAQGSFKGQPLKAHGVGGSVLGLHDELTPYPLQADLSVGQTVAKVDGTITSLLRFTAMDMRLALRGESLAQLYPLLGLVFPQTRAYATEGRIVHSGTTWEYEKFTGRIGESDIAGSLQVTNGGKRPALNADLVSERLDVADLGALIGVSKPSRQAAAPAAPAPADPLPSTPQAARLLPDMPFTSDRWDSVDAEVSLKAGRLWSKGIPLEGLATHLSLRDSLLTLDPLKFGMAGGNFQGSISLDGRTPPIQAHARMRVENVRLARLFPAAGLGDSKGQLNGEFDLAGNGDSVRRMLATSSGQVRLVVQGGEISQLMMEQAGVHLWEILDLKVTGDHLVELRCAVANLEAKAGVMHAEALVFDTQVTTIIGTGSIDLGKETLDLVLNQKTKRTSPLALRSPILVRGSFARPEVSVDKGRLAVRAFGAVALGLLNPLLAVLPLIDAGPGADSDCGQLVRAAGAVAQHAK